jgi:type IV pilus assembly protein PilC
MNQSDTNETTPLAAKPNRKTSDPDLKEHLRHVLEEEIRHPDGDGKASSLTGLRNATHSLRHRLALGRFGNLGRSKQAAFTRELSLLLRTGMPILDALRSIGTRTQDPKVKDVVLHCGTQLEAGKPLSEALKDFPASFSTLYVNMVKAGEDSGKLEMVLERLADHAERENEIRGKIGTMMIYPVFILVFAGLICGILTAVTIPVFRRLTDEFGADLPFITRALVGLAHWLPQVWFLGLLVLVGIGIVYVVLARTSVGALLIDRVKLYVPVLGQLHRKILAARFSRTFALLYESGISILRALRTTEETIGNTAAARDIAGMRRQIEEGESLQHALTRTALFPPLMVEMISVGEQSGQLHDVLPLLAERYEKEVDRRIETVVRLLEPIVIIVLGLIVATVFAAFFIPYLRILSAAGRL